MISRRLGQRGQALAESLILLIVLVPFAIAIEQLMRLSLIQHSVLSSARYLLLEQHHSPGSDSLSGSRFSAVDTPLAVHLEHLVGTSSRSSLEQEIADGRLTEGLTPAMDLALWGVALAEPVGPGELALNPDLTRQARARLRIEWDSGLGRWLAGNAIIFEESLSLVTDTWQVADRDAFHARVRAISVAGRMQQISEPLQVVRSVLEVIEPSFEGFCPGRIVLESVPEDRVVSSDAGANDWRRMPC